MPLHKLEDFNPNSQDFGDDIKSMKLYTEGGEDIGTVRDALVDPEGHFRYLVIETGFETASKKILLPIGLARIDYNTHRVTVDGLTKLQVEGLPEYNEQLTVDYDYEEQVRNVYRPLVATTQGNELTTPTYNQDSYSYENDSLLYNLNKPNQQTLKLYEERLIASKNRVKTGEVAVGKHVETETAKVSVALEKERVVIERVSSVEGEKGLNPGEFNFQEGEIARIEVYEETPEIHKEAFVREEIRIRKIVEHNTVEAEEIIRREELDIDTKGQPDVNQMNTVTHDGM
ncbi:DUF2382 domain-containing protein [Gloeocapsopsis dulcis]|uniref:Photosystem reaction center subunit H n=1 Tax=Gloeocapsopsis dulcis AAB1 = 1H9 TaxID=1433147 RepID=A0A6N8FU29_9CHRO|nr:DUF2382 domain-containing protein [Gloeocapsopsis dulcis]MUL36613.1 photosystem reaction center subunit H [Gloeocapsopsis dulcis AAB1 = 1H9]WNN87237.1 DUF2382 domain-containing protein [Gloeocapsopsis dulcis]